MKILVRNSSGELATDAACSRVSFTEVSVGMDGVLSGRLGFARLNSSAARMSLYITQHLALVGCGPPQLRQLGEEEHW